MFYKWLQELLSLYNAIAKHKTLLTLYCELFGTTTLILEKYLEDKSGNSESQIYTVHRTASNPLAFGNNDLLSKPFERSASTPLAFDSVNTNPAYKEDTSHHTSVNQGVRSSSNTIGKKYNGELEIDSTSRNNSSKKSDLTVSLLSKKEVEIIEPSNERKWYRLCCS